MPYQLRAGQWRAACNGPTLSGLGCNMLPFVILRARRSYSLASASPEHLLHREHFSIFCAAQLFSAFVLLFPRFDANTLLCCRLVLLSSVVMAVSNRSSRWGEVWVLFSAPVFLSFFSFYRCDYFVVGRIVL